MSKWRTYIHIFRGRQIDKRFGGTSAQDHVVLLMYVLTYIHTLNLLTVHISVNEICDWGYGERERDGDERYTYALGMDICASISIDSVRQSRPGDCPSFPLQRRQGSLYLIDIAFCPSLHHLLPPSLSRASDQSSQQWLHLCKSKYLPLT